MRTMALIFAALSLCSAHAFNSLDCSGNENYGTDSSVQVKLTAASETVDQAAPGSEVLYHLDFKDSDVAFSQPVLASQEDSVVFISSSGSKYGEITGMFFMSELDESSIQINHRDFFLKCE